MASQRNPMILGEDLGSVASGQIFPVASGHDPFHEFVEQWNGESRVAVGWAPDHAFGN